MIGKFSAALLLCLTTVASADVLKASEFDPSDPLTPIENVQGRGIKIGEGTILQPVVALESGFVSNVFYEEDPTPAGVMRLVLQVGVASLGRDRLNPSAPNTDDTETNEEGDVVDVGSFQYQLNLRTAYLQPLSGNETVQDSGGVGFGGLFKGMVNPTGAVSFGFDENFLRLIRASNFETATNENRIINMLRLMLVYHPQGRTLHGFLYYDNQIDVFESEASDTLYPDRITHRVGIRPTWQWLPKTQLYGDFSMGYTTGFGDSPAAETKSDSYPLNLRIGVSTLLSAKTSLNAAVGYINGFYSEGPSFSRPVGDVGLSYRYSALGRIGLRYQYVHQDSVNANFYRDHAISAYLSQQVDPVQFLVQPEVRFRRYEGITLMGAPSDTRDDVIFQVISGVHYNFRNWIAAALEYKFSTVQTDFEYMSGGSTVELDFLRHEILAGLRVAM